MTQQPDRWAQLAQELWGMVLPMMTGTEQRRELAAALRSAHDAGRREGLEAAALLLDKAAKEKPVDMYDCYPDATPSAKEGT